MRRAAVVPLATAGGRIGVLGVRTKSAPLALPGSSAALGLGTASASSPSGATPSRRSPAPRATSVPATSAPATTAPLATTRPRSTSVPATTLPPPTTLAASTPAPAPPLAPTTLAPTTLAPTPLAPTTLAPTTLAPRIKVPASASATGELVNHSYGILSVSVTVSVGKLTHIGIATLDDGGDFCSQAIDEQVIPILEQEALRAQSANIQAVAGASSTSAGLAQSLQSARSKLGR